MRRGIVAVAALAAVALAAPPAAPAAQQGLRAGAADADLTPPVGTPMFAYTARSNLTNPPRALQVVADPDTNLYAKSFVPSRGIHTRLRARAIVLERGAEKLALVQADLGGVPYALIQEVARRVAHTGITSDRLLLSATHTHSATGPIWPADSPGYAALGGDLFDPRVFELTAQGIAEAILAADARVQPARAGVGTAAAPDASRNRSFGSFRRNPEAPADEAAARAAAVDPTVTVLRVDSVTGRPMAVWSNFAIHPTSFGDDQLLFSGDNAAYTERIVERAIGRGALNVWTNGSQGDISPNGGPDRDGDDPLQYVPNSYASAHLAGARVAKGVVDAWRAAGERMARDMPIGVQRDFVGFDGTPAGGEPVGPLEVLGFGGIVGPEGFCAPVDNMSGPGQGRKMWALGGVGLVPQIAPMSVARVGPLAIAALPAEITRTMGARIQEAVRAGSGGAAERVALAGLTNGYVSYTSTPEEYDACDYEGSFTLFGRRQGVRWLEFGAALARSLYGGAPGPQGAPEPPANGFGSGPGPVLRSTPSAGEVVEQPASEVDRFGRATLRWQGGDPAVDAPRGWAFVQLQRRGGRTGWTTVGTDDGYRDTTEREPGGTIWRETWQFAPCDRPGEYRLLVRGLANRGGGVMPYEVASEPFRLRALSGIVADPPVVTGGAVRVVARYPDPGEDALLALPRRVRDGFAELRVTEPDGDVRTVRAVPDAARLAFVADVEPGSTARVVRVEDGCGNTGA
jgi:neutral ceramidase